MNKFFNIIASQETSIKDSNNITLESILRADALVKKENSAFSVAIDSVQVSAKNGDSLKSVAFKQPILDAISEIKRRGLSGLTDEQILKTLVNGYVVCLPSELEKMQNTIKRIFGKEIDGVNLCKFFETVCPMVLKALPKNCKKTNEQLFEFAKQNYADTKQKLHDNYVKAKKDFEEGLGSISQEILEANPFLAKAKENAEKALKESIPLTLSFDNFEIKVNKLQAKPKVKAKTAGK